MGADLKAVRTGDGCLTLSLFKLELNRLRRGLLMMLEMIPKVEIEHLWSFATLGIVPEVVVVTARVQLA